MKVTERAPLTALNSFGTAASSALLYEIESEEDLLALPAFDPRCDLVLGGGSNVLLATDIPGAVYLNRIKGIDIIATGGDSVRVEAAAGESWHGLVEWSLERGLSGLENLSLIPGLVGAAPIQNIGAYGVELSSVLRGVTAWDWRSASWVTLSARQCQLAYRDSLFKSVEPDRYLLTSIQLELSEAFEPQLQYAGLREELETNGLDLHALSARDVSKAVVRIRRRKLPDPARLGNAGSFFKNPLIDASTLERLRSSHPDLAAWSQDGGQTKIAAAWLIEHCGLKGLRDGDAAVSDQHALVLVNHGTASGQDLARLARHVQSRVNEEFGIRLETEPRIVEFAR